MSSLATAFPAQPAELLVSSLDQKNTQRRHKAFARKFYPLRQASSVILESPAYNLSNVELSDSAVAIAALAGGRIGFQNINSTGTKSTVSNVDDYPYEHVILSNWRFPFFGYEEKNIYINPNGFIARLPEPCDRNFCSAPYLPAGVGYQRFLGPILSDFDPSCSSLSGVYYLEDQVNTTHRLTVQWDYVSLFQNDCRNKTSPNFATAVKAEDTFTFQVIIEETGDVYFNYLKVPFDPATKTVTIINPNFTFKQTSLIGLQDAVVYDSKVSPYVWLGQS